MLCGYRSNCDGSASHFLGATEARFSSPEEAGHRSSNTGRAKVQAMRELQQLGKKRLRRGDLVDRRKQTWTQPKA